MKKSQSAEKPFVLEYLTNHARPKTLLLTSPEPGRYALVIGKRSKSLTLLEAFQWYCEHDNPNRADCFSVQSDVAQAQSLFNRVAEFARKGGAR
jgi:hypothetical protein